MDTRAEPFGDETQRCNPGVMTWRTSARIAVDPDNSAGFGRVARAVFYHAPKSASQCARPPTRLRRRRDLRSSPFPRLFARVVRATKRLAGWYTTMVTRAHRRLSNALINTGY